MDFQTIPPSEVGYHEDTECVGKSGLDLINRSPLHYWERYLNPDREWKPDTPAQLFGSLVHCVILEPEKVAERYITVPPDMTKKGNAWNDFKAVCSEKRLRIVDDEDMAKAQKICAAVHEHKVAGRLLSRKGVAEKPIYAVDPVTGVRVRIKPDRFIEDNGIILDLKTTTDARKSQFSRDIYNHRYHVQDAFYTDVATWAGHKIETFAFIAVEKEPPYAVAVHILDDESREEGRMTYREDLNTYAACLKAGQWHGYPEDVDDLSIRLPKWAFR